MGLRALSLQARNETSEMPRRIVHALYLMVYSEVPQGRSQTGRVRGPESVGLMSRNVTSTRLTTCSVVKEGRAIRLEFLDADGQPASVEFAFDQAESIIMTLPQMLSKALQRRTHSPSSRYVFSLGRWSIESCDAGSLIATLSTADGFQVSFNIPFDACRAIGQALRHEGEGAMEQESPSQSADEARLLN
jgi:hypothetical protein